MTKYAMIFAALLSGASVPATSQEASPAVAIGEPSPAHLAAATRLMDVMMPPAQRDAMIDGMIQAVMTNVSNGVLASEAVKSAVENRPGARAVFDRFVARQMERSQASLRANLPSMIEALAAAYARRFDAAQLAEMEGFFSTSTGQAYVAQSSTIMSDPDVAAWQQRVFAADMAELPAEIERMVAELSDMKGARRP